MAERREDFEVKQPTPNGCRVCGAEKRDHPQRWHPVTGYHTWIEPLDSQRLHRMWARRTERAQAARTADVRRRYRAFLDDQPQQPGLPARRTGKPGLYPPKLTGSKLATLEILSVLRQIRIADANRREALRG